MQDQPTDGDFVFVSYASKNRAQVVPVVEALRGAGVRVWFDVNAIEGGENYAREIAEGIEHCTAFVLMCSEASFASRNCRQEIALAWKYQRPYVPLLLEMAPVPKEIEYWLEAAQWVEVLDHPAERWLPRVLRALNGMGYPVVLPEEARADDVVVAQPVAPASRLLPPEPPPIFGRQRELAEARDVLDATIDGQGGTLLIGGEAGVGKSSLVDTVVYEAATRRSMVLTGHCYDLSTTPPYGPWVEAFKGYTPGPGLPASPAALRGDTSSPVTSQDALFEEVVRFVRAVSVRQPLVIDLEDLHWADPGSLDLLRYVARQVRDVRVMLIGTFRGDELTRRHPLSQLLPILTREAGAERLNLERLDEVAVRQLVEERYHLPERDCDRLVGYVCEHSEGHALYMSELLRTLEDEGVLTEAGEGQWTLGDLSEVHVPKLVREVIEARVARLPEEIQKVLTVAAVIGQEVPVEVWGEVADESDDELLESIDQAEKANLISSSASGESVRFTHALIREALYETVMPLRRRSWHKKIGEVLEETKKPEPSAVAYHFRQANDARAIGWLIKAGKRAERTFALASAAADYDEALQMALDKEDEPGLAEARAATGELLRKQSKYSEARAFLEEARANFEALGDQAGIGMVLHYLGTLEAQQGDFTKAKELYEQSLEIRRALNDREQIGNLLSNLGIVARGQGRIADARALHEEALSLRRVLGDKWSVANSLNNLANVLLDEGDLQLARQNLEEAVKISRSLDDPFALANALNNLANVVRSQGDFATAHMLYAESLNINAELGDNRAIAYLLEDIGSLAVAEGSADRALKLISAAARLRKEIGSPRFPAEQKQLDALLAKIREMLDESSQTAAESVGAAMAVNEAVAVALG